MKTGLAITGTLLKRHRTGLLVVAACYLWGLSAYSIPDLPRRVELLNETTRIVVLILGSIPLFALPFGILYLIAIFTNPDSDVASPRSTYPSHYFTLPVRSFELALWPMAVGCTLLAGAVALFLLVASHSKGGGAVNLAEPALVAAAFLAVFQAIFWFPFGLPYSKLILTFVAIAFLMVVMASEPLFGIGELGREGIYAGVILLSLVGAITGVSRARTGFSSRSRIAFREGEAPARPAKAIKIRKPFASPEAAQFWYEWRRQGILLPIVSAIMIALFLIPHYWDSASQPILDIQTANGLTVCGPAFLVVFFPVLLAGICIASWAIGLGAKRTDVKKSADRLLHLMVATRPMTDVALVMEKLKAAALGTAVTGGLALALTAGILTCAGSIFDPNTNSYNPTGHMLFQTLLPLLTPSNWIAIGCTAALFLLVIFRNFVVGIWAELSTQSAWGYLQGLVTGVAFMALIALWGARGGSYITPNEIYFVAWFAVVLKFCGLAFVLFRQRKNGLLNPRFVAGVSATYCVAVGFMIFAVHRLVSPPPMNNTPYPQPMYDTLAAAYSVLPLAAVFFVPIVRIVLAPEMLYWNRHRR